MSVVEFVVQAEARSDEGKGASRRLRRAGKVPAVIYGGDKAPASLSLVHHIMLQHVEHEAFYSHILTIEVAGKKEQAILKDMQWHPHKPSIMHMDFQRVDASSTIRVNVPLHFTGEESAPGAKAGGIVSHMMTNVEVSCLATQLPEYIEVDLSGLELDGSIHLSDIKLPSGVELIELSHGEGHDQAVASIHLPRGAASAEEETGAAAEEGQEEEGSAE